MVHGAPDYGIYAPKSTIAALEDLGEAVARLGGIATFDRRGDVVYCDDYESPIERFSSWANALCDVRLDSQFAHSGAQSVLFALDGTMDNSARVYHPVPVFPQGKHGIKITASLYKMYVEASYYYVYAEHRDGAFQCKWGLKINPKEQKLYYTDNAFAFQELQADFKWVGDKEYWFHNIKFVVDLVTGKYVRLLINNTEWDMSAYSLQRVASALAPRCLVTFVLYDEAGYAFNCWQDDFVYTINEP